MYNNSVQIYQEQYHHLVAANFSNEQAEAIMRVIEDRQVQALGDLATKRDLEDLRLATKRDLEDLRLATKRDLEELRLATKQDIAEVRNELKRDITEVRHELALLDSKLTHRMTIGFIAVGALSLASPHLPDIIRFITALMK